jgi:hypothetical protein
MADFIARMGDTLVTVDDFDPLVSYSNYADWTTPDPSQNPTWFNATEEVTGSQWHQGTLEFCPCDEADIQLHTIRPVSLEPKPHSISLVSLLAYSELIIGSNIAIYGAGTSYTITIDPSSQQPYNETITGGRNETGRNVLYSTDALTFSPHTIEITNEGDFLLLDLFEFNVDVGGTE